MTARDATRYLYWYGEKMLAGDPFTESEVAMFKEARKISMALAQKYMLLSPKDWKYTPGEEFK
jgi:hypothetical protein